MGGFLALGSFMLLQPNPEPIIVPVSNDETIHSAALTSYQLDTTAIRSPKASTSTAARKSTPAVVHTVQKLRRTITWSKTHCTIF